MSKQQFNVKEFVGVARLGGLHEALRPHFDRSINIVIPEGPTVPFSLLGPLYECLMAHLQTYLDLPVGALQLFNTRSTNWANGQHHVNIECGLFGGDKALAQCSIAPMLHPTRDNWRLYPAPLESLSLGRYGDSVHKDPIRLRQMEEMSRKAGESLNAAIRRQLRKTRNQPRGPY